VHDANGNLTNDGRFQYDWDGYNRLWRVRTLGGATVATYCYDAENRRVRKSVSGGATTDYLYDGWRVIEERPVVSGVQGNAQRQLVYGTYLDEVLVADVDADADGDCAEFYGGDVIRQERVLRMDKNNRGDFVRTYPSRLSAQLFVGIAMLLPFCSLVGFVLVLAEFPLLVRYGMIGIFVALMFYYVSTIVPQSEVIHFNREGLTLSYFILGIRRVTLRVPLDEIDHFAVENTLSTFSTSILLFFPFAAGSKCLIAKTTRPEEYFWPSCIPLLPHLKKKWGPKKVLVGAYQGASEQKSLLSELSATLDYLRAGSYPSQLR